MYLVFVTAVFFKDGGKSSNVVGVSLLYPTKRRATIELDENKLVVRVDQRRLYEQTRLNIRTTLKIGFQTLHLGMSVENN